MLNLLTASQAAFVLGEPLDAFRKVVERGPVRAGVTGRGGARVRQFTIGDLVFLSAERELKSELTPKGRAELYAALTEVPGQGAAREVAFGDLTFNYGRHLDRIEARLRELEQLAGEIDTSGPVAMIRATTIEAHRIAALLEGGMTAAAVMRDYPSLNERQILAARAYAEAHPKSGRPYPKITAKAAMRGACLDGIEEFCLDGIEEFMGPPE